MGLFSFLKKKDSAASGSQPSGFSGLNTDLPSIDGSSLGELTLPSLDESPVASEQNPFVPPSDGIAETVPESHVGGYHDRSLHSMPDDVSTEINQLFLSDPEWKEPDWEHYEPYYEDNIEPPTMEDFGMSSQQSSSDGMELPDIHQADSVETKSFVVPEFEDVELPEHHVPEDVPYDVFVRGTDYSRVFSEMDDVKKMLVMQDENLSKVLETFKQEDITINSCKDNMELLYKKMLMIDKKVFA